MHKTRETNETNDIWHEVGLIHNTLKMGSSNFGENMMKHLQAHPEAKASAGTRGIGIKRIFGRFFRRRKAPSTGLCNLPQSVAYSALLASGVEGASEVSFAQFLAGMHAQSAGCHRRNG